MRELLPHTGVPRKKKKKKQSTPATHDESLSIATDDTPGTPCSSALDISSDGIFDTSCDSRTCSTPYSSSATEVTPSASGTVLQARPTDADSQVDSVSCKACESPKKKRRTILKKLNKLKQKYAALQQKFNELQNEKVCTEFVSLNSHQSINFCYCVVPENIHSPPTEAEGLLVCIVRVVLVPLQEEWPHRNSEAAWNHGDCTPVLC